MKRSGKRWRTQPPPADWARALAEMAARGHTPSEKTFAQFERFARSRRIALRWRKTHR